MNIETIKSFILTILVLISILLTFSLWNYKPDYDRIYNAPHDYVNEVDIGGAEVSKKDIIQPNLMIFHYKDDFFGFSRLRDQQNLYKDMQSWVIYDFEPNATQINLEKSNKLEIIFPTAIPMQVVGSIFHFYEDFSEELMPSWSFERMYIVFNEEDSTLSIQFMSLDGKQQSEAIVNNSSIYNELMSYMADKELLTEYTLFDSAKQLIYLPLERIEMIRRSLTVENIETSLLVDALFSNPSLVSHNIRESSFSDGQRALNIIQEGRSMEYYNPIETDDNEIDMIELLEQSIENINEHKGWTEDYHLDDIAMSTNKVRYRMHYDGYPVFNNIDLSIIEQQWRGDDLHLYIRLLFTLNDSLGGDTINLPSGNELINYLKNNSKYKIDKINDIQIGYKLLYLEDASYSVVLEPAWYIDYDGNWIEIKFDEFETMDKGGA